VGVRPTRQSLQPAAITSETWTAPCRRVVRGGSWNNNPRNLRAANRNRNTTDNRNNNNGFRLGSTLFARAGAITVAPGVH
jgi:formylglycine-generating enzyme required for sulfatase activity